MQLTLSSISTECIECPLSGKAKGKEYSIFRKSFNEWIWIVGEASTKYEIVRNEIFIDTAGQLLKRSQNHTQYSLHMHVYVSQILNNHL